MKQKSSGNELTKLMKKFARLEKKYDEAEGQPLVQARLMKSAKSVEKKIDKIKNN